MECLRCGGAGKIKKVKHVNNGICFECNGKGYILSKNEVMVEFKKEGKIIGRMFCTTESSQKEVRQKGRELGATSMVLIKGGK